TLIPVLLDGPAGGGTLELHTDGSLDYTAPDVIAGTFSFTVGVQESQQGQPGQQGPQGPSNLVRSAVRAPSPGLTVTFVVSAPPPVASADMFSTPEDQPLLVAAPGVLANDYDLDGGSLS